MKREKEEGFNPINYALEFLREEHGLDMSAAQLSKYLDKERINSRINEIQKSSKFKRINTDEEKNKFLYSEIINYIVEDKPFDERGKRLLENDLEGIVGREGLWSRIFSSPEKRDERRRKSIRDYVGSKKTARELSYAVAENPEEFSGAPQELIEAFHESRGYRGRGTFADILYSAGEISKEKYAALKSGIKDASKRFVELAKDYAESTIEPMKRYAEAPAMSYITAVLGILLIFLFNPIKPTGAIIGLGNSENNIFSFIGIALLFISGLSFIFRGRKLKQ